MHAYTTHPHVSQTISEAIEMIKAVDNRTVTFGDLLKVSNDCTLLISSIEAARNPSDLIIMLQSARLGLKNIELSPLGSINELAEYMVLLYALIFEKVKAFDNGVLSNKAKAQLKELTDESNNIN
jgi:hypothetical protein